MRGNFPLYGLSQHLLLKLLEAYRDNQCLWDSGHKDYRNYQVKAEAWDKLLAILRIQDPTADRDKMKQKINTIRTNYIRTRKRMLNAQQPVEPRRWYYRYLDFLSSQVKPTVSHSNRGNGRLGRSNTENKTYKSVVNDLIQHLPEDQKQAAGEFICEILVRAMMHQTRFLKLSIGIDGTEVVLIPKSKPESQMLALPSTSTLTPEELQQRDIAETQNAVRSLQSCLGQSQQHFQP